MTDYLSPQELADLTGSPQHVRQAAWLRRHGWKFVVALDGRPRVLRAYRDKAASDVGDVEDARRLLGHAAVTTTTRYRRSRVGERAKPVMREIEE